MLSALLRIPQWIAGRIPRAWIPTLYRLGPISSLIRGMMNLVAPSGLTRVQIASGLLKGKSFELNLKTEKDLWLGSYEIPLQTALEALVKPGMTAFDIGANIGYISLMLAECVGPEGKVYAFEPLTENVDRLNHNLSINGMADQVIVMPVAIGGFTGESGFYTHPSKDMGKLIGSAGRDLPYTSEIKTRVARLDDLVFEQGLPKPDVIKIDIEGGELLAMPGMRKVMEDLRPIILIEIHGLESARAVWTAFSSSRYRCYQLKAGYPVLERIEALDWKSYLVAAPIERKVRIGERIVEG